MIPKVRRAVIACQVDCNAMCQQVDDLMNFKDLHDQLHHVQFNCYEPVARIARASTIDEEARDALFEYELNLQDIIDNLREIEGRFGRETSGADWLKRLAEARQELRDTIE